MDTQKDNKTAQPLVNTPGRRYNAGRLAKRAGIDVGSVRRKSAVAPVRPEPRVTPVAQPSAPKHIDFVSPKHHKKPRNPSHVKPALPRQKKSLVLKRQMVERAKEHRQKIKIRHKRKLVRYTILGMVCLALGIVLWSFKGLLPFSINWFEQSAPSAVVTSTQPISDSAPLDETRPTAEDIAAHKMADDAPRLLKIPSLSIEARIKRVGVSLIGEPIAPSSIFDVGWFEASGKPGEDGAVLLNGHTFGPTASGVFYELDRLMIGDLLLLETGDGKTVTFMVSKVQQYSPTEIDMSAAMNSIDRTKRGLNLMTTPSRYDGRASDMSKRIVVFAIEQPTQNEADVDPS